MTSFLIAFEPVIVVVHFIMAFILIGVILLQAGKGTDIGAVFGAGAKAVFGSSDKGNIFTKLTTVAAIMFLITSLSLATISKFHVSGAKSVVESSVVADSIETEAAAVEEGAAE
ncbi:MAG: preprotein translocase subunit SecG [bacterium]|nr:preprotein translocase subunit SecG [bacterium]